MVISGRDGVVVQPASTTTKLRTSAMDGIGKTDELHHGEWHRTKLRRVHYYKADTGVAASVQDILQQIQIASLGGLVMQWVRDSTYGCA